MKSDKYSLVVLSILLILLLFIGSASAADSNGTDVLSADKSTDTVEKLALDTSSDNAVANDTNVLRNNGNDLLSMDNNLKSNELSDDTLKISNDELLTAGNSWYVNSSKTSSGDGSSDEKAFQTLNKALDKAENGDTIMIASGEYKGTDNIGLSINKKLSFEKYGDDEAIFDAENQSRIWEVSAATININGLTFKNGKSNGYGGAIFMDEGNVINCTFTGNNATGSSSYGGGGAIYMDEGNVINCTFTGNTATGSSSDGGGAIYMDKGNVINCTFTGNTANGSSTIVGGAIYCTYGTNVINCNFTGNYARYGGGAIYLMRGGNVSDCTFTNNNATYWGGAILLETYDDTKGNVTNCAFVNNTAKIKAISSSRALESVDNNWWGSNNPNWDELIDEAGIPSSYAVLNGSADATTIKPGSKAKLTYGFYSNATGDLLSIPSRPIELSATGGHLDDDTGYLVNGEFSTEFSSEALGEFEITAAVDNQEVKLTETVAATVWYVNATVAPGGDGKSNETAFQTLKEALTDAENGDIIMIASGTYTGTDNRGLSIDKKLSFEKYGDGEAIFDAQGQNRFWLVEYGIETININGLTFKNGKASYGGAICFNSKLSNSVINATFINNNADNGGGAIYMASGGDKVNITGEFINNTATGSNKEGGAIYFNDVLSNSIINATFINNNADNNGRGGAISFNKNANHDNVIIYGEFRNNEAVYGGAVYFNGQVSSSNINAVFINNTALSGGAVVFMRLITNVNITGDFINNTATGSDQEGGGANYFNKEVINVSISGNFIGNCAEGSADSDGGAANYFLEASTNVDITGKFINNTGKNVIYFTSVNTGNVIHDSIFINNNVSKIIYASGEVAANDNWFGNNATNYDEAPADVGIDLDNWLFLNATADPSEIGVGQNSTIKFKLYNKNSSDTEYDDSKMNIQLDLTQTLGKLDKTAASLGEEITYTAMEVGDASVTATFETASYTLKLKNSGIPTVLNLYMIYPGEYNPSFTVDIRGTVKNKMTGVTIKKGSVKLYLNGENVKNITVDGDEGSISYSFEVLDAGNYTVKAVYHDDTGEFLDCEWNSSFEIKQATTEITINNTSIELIIGNGTIIEAVLSPSEAGNLNYSSNDTSVAVVNKNGEITAVGAGTANITVSFEGNNNYAASQNYTVVTVSKIPAEINITQPSIEAGIGGTGQITGAELIPSEAGNLTYSSNDTNVVWVSSNGDFTTYSAGTALITVSFAGNENYTAAESKTITFTVNKWPTNITLKNETFDLKVYDEVPSGAALDPSYAGELNYTSSDESVVKVENGNIKAVGVGQATVTVSFGGARNYEAAENKTIAVTVDFADARVDAEDMELTVDENGTIKYYTTPADLNVTFVPDNSGVVSVDENGTVTALKGGIATITVKVGGDGIYAENSTTVTVIVSKIATEIIIQNVTADMKVNEEFDPVVSIMPSGAGELDFTSSDVSVVTVNGIGTITAVGEGVANVTVRFMGNDKYAAAESKNITVIVGLNDASVSVNNSTLDLVADDTFTIIANTTPSGLNVTYIPDNSGVVSVDENGTVTALKGGNATITVKVGGDGVYAENSTTVTVTVSKKSVKIDLTEDGYAVYVDDIYDNLAVLQDVDGNNITDEYRLDYTSSDESVVKIVDDSFVAVGEGLATITVSFNGTDKYESADDASFKVGVFKKESSIDIEPKSVEIVAGEDAPITVILPEDATGIVLVDVGDNKYYGDVENGNATVNIAGLTAGNYTAKVIYPGDDKYINASSSVSIKVNEIPEPVDSKVNVTVPDVKVGETAKAVVELPSDATGNVIVRVDGKEAAALIVYGGTVEIPLGVLTAGNHTVVAVYSGNSKYDVGVATKDITVEKLTANITADPVEVVEGETATVTVTVDENATGTVLVEVGANKYYAEITAGKAAVDVVGLTAGDYTAEITYTGDDKYREAKTTAAVKVDAQPAPKTESSIAIVEVNGYNITGILKDDSGKGIADAQIKYAVNGTEKTVITAKDGSFVIEALPNSPVSIDYAGDNTTEPTKTSITIKEYDSPVPVKVASRFNITNNAITIYGYAVDVNAGEHGILYSTELLDANGKPISNAFVQFAVNNKIYNRTTYENGSIDPYHLDMVRAGRYTMAFSFGGDDNYTSTFAVVCVDLDKKPITIKASAKTYKVKTKIKKYTVQLKTIVGSSLDGKAHLRSGLVVKLKVNGKTYTGKTNSLGKVTFKITNLSKKANYKAKISYAGDKTYESASKTVTLKVK